MFIELGLMFAAYLGVRIIDKQKRAAERQAPPAEDSEPADAPVPVAGELSRAPIQSLIRQEQRDPIAFNRSYAHLSLLSTGLLAVRRRVPAAGPLGLGLFFYAALPFINQVEQKALRDRKVDVDVLFFVADALTLGLGFYATAGISLWMRYFGREGAARAKDQSKKIINDIFAELPSTVWVVIDGVEVEVPLDQVKVDDIVVVNTGEVIPVDGRVVKGMASIYQQALTGEAQPAEKGIGDQVYANTFISVGHLHIQVEKSGQETEASKISSILLSAVDRKTNLQLKGEEWADRATLPMLVASGIMLPVLGPVSAVVFINSHMGNRLRTLAPRGTLQHISVASRNGILIKDGRALERLSDVDTLLFDKTGTLTSEVPEVIRVIAFDSYRETQVLRFAVAAEGKLTHPIARAIIQRGQELMIAVPDISDSDYQIGYGVTLFLDGQVIRVGSARFMAKEDVTPPTDMQDVMAIAHHNGDMLVWVAVGNRVIGAIELRARVRPEVRSVLRNLRKNNINHLAIVSGDHQHPTRQLADELGVDEYFHSVLPEQKSDIVTQLQKQGRTVCFVGDGINDAIAMQQADVSVSLAGASTVATDVAEIVLLDGSLSSMTDLFYISNSLHAVFQRSLILNIAPGVINLAGATILNFQIMTSMLVSFGFGCASALDMMRPLKLPGSSVVDPPTRDLAGADARDHSAEARAVHTRVAPPQLVLVEGE